MIDSNFECTYCSKQYVREDAYMKHRCKEMDRADEIKTPIGQAAYLHYSTWMNMNKRRAPTIEVFTTSRFYVFFIKFAGYIKRVSIPDVESFISLMVERDLSPSLWLHDKVYVLYIEHLDRKVGPMRQATTTINTLFKIADAAQCDVSEIFNHMHPAEVIQLIRQRRLSPWILLNSQKFKHLYASSGEDHRSVFEELIRPMFWKIRFDKNPKVVSLMKQYVDELGL